MKDPNDKNPGTETTGDELPLTDEEMDTLRDWPSPDSWEDKK